MEQTNPHIYLGSKISYEIYFTN